jgi:hypothetical protein
MADRITTCPVEGCGAELQATAVRYLSRVAIDPDTRQIVAYEVYDGNDSDGFAWDHSAATVYCGNDHPLTDWQAPPNVERGGHAGDPAPFSVDLSAAVSLTLAAGTRVAVKGYGNTGTVQGPAGDTGRYVNVKWDESGAVHAEHVLQLVAVATAEGPA